MKLNNMSVRETVSYNLSWQVAAVCVGPQMGLLPFSSHSQEKSRRLQ